MGSLCWRSLRIKVGLDLQLPHVTLLTLAIDRLFYKALTAFKNIHFYANA